MAGKTADSRIARSTRTGPSWRPKPSRSIASDTIRERLPVGNTYVNRDIIGAVVGVQPFGGRNLSGIGPKAGGSHYLPRFATERTLSVKTTAAGGNAGLILLENED